MSQTGEILSAALEGLKENGWTVDDVVDNEGRMCAQGALLTATLGDARGLGLHITDDAERYAARVRYDLAMETLARHIPEDFDEPSSRSVASVESDVCGYNNTRTSFENEIVPWFEKAIADERIEI